MLALLLEGGTDDSIEIAVHFTRECGQLLKEECPKGLLDVMSQFRAILRGTGAGAGRGLDMRVQVTVEALMEAQRDGFKGFPARLPELDLVEADDQITHEVTLDQKLAKHDELDVFRADDRYEENEALWRRIRAEIFGQEVESDSSDSSSGSESSGSGSDSDSDSDEDE